MMPVEVTTAPWHYTNIWEGLDHWQTAVAGAGAVIAAFVTIFVTLGIERRKVKREVVALRKSIGNELRLQISNALGVYDGLRELGNRPDGPITARMVESKSRLPATIVFQATADKLGLLDDDAMDVLIVYTLLEAARDSAARVMTFRERDNINPAVVLGLARIFLSPCSHALGILPKLRTGVASHDDKDAEFIKKITAALAVL
jgi:hypothetical protein